MQADDLRALADRLRGMAPKVWMVAYDSGVTRRSMPRRAARPIRLPGWF